MGKKDQKAAEKARVEAHQTGNTQFGAGQRGSENRIFSPNGLQNRADEERQNVLNNYNDMSRTGGLRPEDESRIRGIFSELSKGIDPAREGRVTGDANALREFARTGGVSDADRARINRPIYEEFERTGGYTDQDKANIRDRSNSSISSAYGGAQDRIKRNSIVQGQVGPGWSSANSKLQRQAAQDTGANIRDIELGINDTIRSGRLSAADRISGNQLDLSRLTSGNTLAGYGNAANIDQNTQQIINYGKQAGGVGLTNLAGLRQQGINAGNQGLLQTYGTAPAELEAEHRRLQEYRNSLVGNQNQNFSNIVQGSTIPGLSSTINSGIGVVRNAAKLARGF